MISKKHFPESSAVGRVVLAQALALATVFAGISTAYADPQQCQLRRMAVLDMQTSRDGTVSVPVTIQGHPARLMVDIGAVYSTLDASFAKSLGLKQWQMYNRYIGMGGGIPLDQYAFADSFALGPIPSGRFGFVLAPSSVLGTSSMGMLGAEVMSSFDIDLDFAGSKFNVFSPDHCPGKVVYWTSDAYAAVPMDLDGGNHIHVSIMLDGKSLTAMLDTGAARSFMNFRAATEIFGIDEKNPQLKALGNQDINGVATVAAYRYPFSSLTFEGVEIRNPDIDIVKYPSSDHGEPDLILGIGVLRQLHMYIAYGEKKLYLTPAEAH